MSNHQNILSQTTEEKLTRALKSNEVVRFVTDVFIESYQRHFYPHTKEIVLMIETAISLLQIELTQKKKEGQSLITISNYINEHIFKTSNKSFWFSRIYSHYKKTIRSKLEYEQIKPYLIGKLILDFGSGIGALALELKKRKYTLFTTDVLDYRIKEAKKIPFKKMKSPTILSYKNDFFDVATVKSVLHHIDKEYLFAVLKELRRVAKRLIIEESVYFTKENTQVNDLIQKQPAFDSFISLGSNKQQLALLLIDFITNALAFGKPDMNLPFEFMCIEDWNVVLQKNGFSIRKIDILGFEQDRVTPDSRALIIADRS
ncbi:MAG: class I SAM-dependent methyltransferase [Patescibacteria group bacterium]